MKVFLFLCFLVFLATAEKQKPFKSVVSHLQDYSSATGGFTLNKRELPSLEATYYALQLATLYGTRQQLLKHIDVTPFIETLQNGDFGYGRRPGVASDLTSLRQAVFSYKLMGYAVPDADKAATYVKSLLNKATGLFANRVEEEGSIQATAFALQVLEALGELKEKPSALQSYLKTATVGDHFNTDSDDLNELADNYFALVVASLVNHKIDNPSKWATYILNKQDKISGGFGSFQETAYAVASLKLLSQDKENFVDKLALDSLYNYAQTASDDLRDLAFAHLAVAPTKKFQENFDIVISYQAAGAPIKGDIVQGTLFKPVLSVKNHNGAPHSGLDADVVVSFAGTNLLESELQFQEDHKQYVSEQSVDTTGKLGVFAVKVVGSVFVPGFGDISLRITDNKRVGYGIVVDSRAFSDVTGKEISEGDAVSVGTDFKFTVTLHNKTVHNLLSGDFAVDFKFLDSSNAVIASSKKDAKNNKDAIVFQYTLKSAAIPAGQLSFSFEVANKEGVHTKHVVKYLLNIPMIASQIVFDQSSTQYKIGDKVRISAVPANYPDLRSVTPLESKDAAGKEISRSFFLDVHSPHGLLLKSVKGVPSKGKLSFEVDVENTMDLIGNNAVSFRYQPAEGASIPLANFDSQLAELYQDSFVLNFTVNADLYVSNLKGTVKNELFYGNQVEFNFTLQDGLTKKVVKAGKQEKANVYLLLQHKDEDRPKIFTSSQHAATQVGDAFSLSYTIDPNAVQGPGVLAIIAQGPDGNTLPVYKGGSSKQELKYDVTIGGKIDFQSKTFTQSSGSNKLASLFHETSFVVEFSLSCQDKVLKDAVLKCNVSTKSGFSSYEPLFSVPVATSKDGVYSTSWILPHEQPTADYILQCYREIDRIRALESKEFKEKRKRKEKEAKGENPNDVPEEPLVLTPFFEIPVHHQSQDSFKLPIRTEVLVTSILAAGFVAAYYKMSVYTTSK